MRRQRTPGEEKSRDYEHQRAAHRVNSNNNKSSRKAWPLLKVRRNRQYRHAVGRLMREAAFVEEESADPLRTVPVRRHSVHNWATGERLGDFVVRRTRDRVRSMLASLFHEDYTSARDRERFAAFFTTALRGRPLVACAIAEAVWLILAGPFPCGNPWGSDEHASRRTSVPTDWHPYATDERYRVQLVAFFVEEPAWRTRILSWLRKMTGDEMPDFDVQQLDPA